MKILVTGGLGFIGSHTVVELQNEGFEVIAIDNLSNSSIEVLDGIEKITGKKPIFENIDLREKLAVQNFFKKNNDIAGVIHFAASKAVGESVEKPLLYYENNINSLVYILQEMANLPLANFIFSSSCTVYGQAKKMPITEDASIQPANSPYGNTKQIGEEIINDVAKVTNINSVLLRYFNPISALECAPIELQFVRRVDVFPLACFRLLGLGNLGRPGLWRPCGRGALPDQPFTEGLP